jgi:hypothetical protein
MASHDPSNPDLSEPVGRYTFLFILTRVKEKKKKFPEYAASSTTLMWATRSFIYRVKEKEWRERGLAGPGIKASPNRRMTCTTPLSP